MKREVKAPDTIAPPEAAAAPPEAAAAPPEPADDEVVEVPEPKLAPTHENIEDGLEAVDVFGEGFDKAYPDLAELGKTKFNVPKEQLDEAMKDPAVRNIVLGMRNKHSSAIRSARDAERAANARLTDLAAREASLKNDVARFKGMLSKAKDAAPKAPTLREGEKPDPYTEAGQRAIAAMETHAILDAFIGGFGKQFDEIEQAAAKTVADQRRQTRAGEIADFAAKHKDFDTLRPDIAAYQQKFKGTPAEAAYYAVRAARHASGRATASSSDVPVPAKAKPVEPLPELPDEAYESPGAMARYMRENPDVAKQFNDRALAR